MILNSYIVFQLNNEEYGVEINNVQEILRLPEHLTHLPNMPSYVEGVINIRGKVIPVIDLKIRFNLPLTDRSEESRLIIININDVPIAVLVDDVSEIVSIDETIIQNVNSIISQLGQNCLTGIGNIGERLILLLDVKKLKVEVFHHNIVTEEAE